MAGKGVYYVLSPRKAFFAASFRPRQYRALSEGEVFIYHEFRVEVWFFAEANAFRASPLRAVEGKKRRRYFRVTYAAVGAGKFFVEEFRASVVVFHLYDAA